MTYPAWVQKVFDTQQEKLKAWRRRHPHEASAVHEEALAKVEKREPKYGPAQCFGVGHDR